MEFPDILEVILDFALYWVSHKRYSLANTKNGFSRKNTPRKVCLPTFTQKCPRVSHYLKIDLVYQLG